MSTGTRVLALKVLLTSHAGRTVGSWGLEWIHMQMSRKGRITLLNVLVWDAAALVVLNISPNSLTYFSYFKCPLRGTRPVLIFWISHTDTEVLFVATECSRKKPGVSEPLSGGWDSAVKNAEPVWPWSTVFIETEDIKLTSRLEDQKSEWYA